MKDFKKGGSGFSGGNRGGKSFGGGRGGSRGGFGGGKSFGGNRGGDREMFQATCSECNKRCDVPFRPTGEKPVYCNDCFGGKRDGSFDKGGRDSRDFGHKSDSKNDFQARSESNKSHDDLKRQVEMLNTKLDALIKMVQSLPRSTSVEPSKESLKSVVEKAQKSKGIVASTKKAAKTTTKAPVKKSAPVKKIAKKAAPRKK